MQRTLKGTKLARSRTGSRQADSPWVGGGPPCARGAFNLPGWRSLLGGVWDRLPFKRLFLEPLRRLGLPARLYKHLHFTGRFSTTVVDSKIVLRSHGHEIENQIFWTGIFGDFEGWSLRVWASMATKAGVVLDVGANTGVYALVARAVNPHATVYAFEPVAPIFQKLLENASLNGDAIRCVEAAVTDREGPTTIFVPKGEHAYSSSLDPGIFGSGVGADWLSREVPSLRLDRFLGCHNLVPDLIKIDVEGQEPQVLSGLGSMLTDHRPTLLLEVLRTQVAEAVWSLLGPLEYCGFEIDEKSGPRVLTPGRKPDAGRNVLFCACAVAEGNELLRGTRESA